MQISVVRNQRIPFTRQTKIPTRELEDLSSGIFRLMYDPSIPVQFSGWLALAWSPSSPASLNPWSPSCRCCRGKRGVRRVVTGVLGPGVLGYCTCWCYYLVLLHYTRAALLCHQITLNISICHNCSLAAIAMDAHVLGLTCVHSLQIKHLIYI